MFIRVLCIVDNNDKSILLHNHPVYCSSSLQIYQRCEDGGWNRRSVWFIHWWKEDRRKGRQNITQTFYSSKTRLFLLKKYSKGIET